MLHCVSFLNINNKFQILAETQIGGDTVQTHSYLELGFIPSPCTFSLVEGSSYPPLPSA